MGKVANLVAFVVFAGFAVVQYNDPDTSLWMALYGYAAMLALFAALNVKVAHPALVGALAYGFLAWRMAPRDLQGVSWIEIEEAREAAGLAICCVWMIALVVMQWAHGRALVREEQRLGATV